MALDRAELWELRLPLRTAIEWTAGGAETEVVYLVLILHDTEGRQGAAEITCRPAWNGMTPALLAEAFEALAWPRLSGLGHEASAITALTDIRGLTALKALCDNAWRDLATPIGPAASVRVASVLTRAAPDAMATRALQIRDETGTYAFKVKLGQGIAKDAQVLAALRKVMPDAELSGDANSAYDYSDLPDLGAVASEMGLAFLEDPCPLQPDAAIGAATASLRVPILADRAVIGPDIIDAFADRGINHFAAKPNRIGASTALAVAQAAQRRGGMICNGTYSESALGAAAQIRFATDLPRTLAHPHEVDFNRDLAAQIAPGPAIRGGYVWPEPGHIAERIDRCALEHFGALRATMHYDRKKETTHG